MYTLIIEDRHGRSAAEISFDQGSYTIGRVDGNDVVLPSTSVSRTHARIFVSNNKCYIDDLDSANGVTVDGEMIKGRTEIRNGSKVRIGDYTLYLEYKDQSEMNAGQDVLKTQIVSSDQSGYKLVRVGGNFAGESFILSEQNNTIGRTEDNYILVSDNSISRNHARIVNTNLVYTVIDLGSSNGTFVNNKKIHGECRLQKGDLIRFGNVSFVFVPATENVDLRQFANKKGKDNKYIALIAGVGLLCMIIVIVFIAVAKNNGEEKQKEAQEQARIENEKADYEKKLQEVQKLFDDQFFEPAEKKVEDLLKVNSSDERLNKLSEQIKFELKHEKIFQDGIKYLESKDYDAAIDKFKLVDEGSVSYKNVEERISEAKHGMRIKAYLDARSKCDEGTTAECISELCDATSGLDPNHDAESVKIEDTKSFMERISKNKKNKHNAAAKKCFDRLNDAFPSSAE